MSYYSRLDDIANDRDYWADRFDLDAWAAEHGEFIPRRRQQPALADPPLTGRPAAHKSALDGPPNGDGHGDCA